MLDKAASDEAVSSTQAHQRLRDEVRQELVRTERAALMHQIEEEEKDAIALRRKAHRDKIMQVCAINAWNCSRQDLQATRQTLCIRLAVFVCG
jgi:hypothetical protein